MNSFELIAFKKFIYANNLELSVINVNDYVTVGLINVCIRIDNISYVVNGVGKNQRSALENYIKRIKGKLLIIDEESDCERTLECPIYFVDWYNEYQIDKLRKKIDDVMI